MLRTKKLTSVKVLWRNQFVEEATWEAEEDMKKIYPHLFEPGQIPYQGTRRNDYSVGFMLSTERDIEMEALP
ncbi:hypothetical protein MTR67_012026, partial [Solanum verrucosum]